MYSQIDIYRKKQGLAMAFLTVFLSLFTLFTQANNLQVSKVSVDVSKVQSTGITYIEFDLQWENSWRLNVSPANYDAVWVFVKYRRANDLLSGWSHLNLEASNHTAPATAIIEPALLRVSESYNEINNPYVGAFIYRAQLGAGTFKVEGVKIALSTPHVFSDKLYDFKVHAIEMVHVPQAPFYVGDGNYGSVHKVGAELHNAANKKSPYHVTSENAITLGGNGANNIGNNNGKGMNDESIRQDDFSSSVTQSLSAQFPKGFNAFYAMKYEITQHQYIAFLNSLTRTQQNNRTATDLQNGITTVANRYVMTNTASVMNRNGIACNEKIMENAPITFYSDLNGNGIANEADDGLHIAANYLSWMDGVAYLDWAGLRPMTELEFEKICRGTLTSVLGEYAWGTNAIKSEGLNYNLMNAGKNNELVGNISTNKGNAQYNTVSDIGAMRVGVLAAAANGAGRETAGAAYYGAMDMSSNVWEPVVTLGIAEGRVFTGMHGDGTLSENGHADVAYWPGLVAGEVTAALGSGYKGGSYSNEKFRLTVSSRYNVTNASTQRLNNNGFRGVRSQNQVSVYSENLSQSPQDRTLTSVVAPLASASIFAYQGGEGGGANEYLIDNVETYEGAIFNGGDGKGDAMAAHSNLWLGSTSSSWSDPTNWTGNYVPYPADAVVFATTANSASDATNDLKVEEAHTVGDLLNRSSKKLVVAPAASLQVKGTIDTNNDQARILIQANSTQPAGTFIFPQTQRAFANVEFYSKAVTPNDVATSAGFVWQYMGVPVKSFAANALAGWYMRQYHEDAPGGKYWVQLNNSSVLTPFTGYQLSRKANTNTSGIATFQGELENADRNLALTVSGSNSLYMGQHVVSNPYTAALNISNGLSFGQGVDATVHFFHTGSSLEWESNNGTAGEMRAQYLSVPQAQAGFNGLPSRIASMQGFVVKANENNAILGFNYGGVNAENTMARVKPRDAQKISTLITMYKGDEIADKAWIFAEPDGVTDGFDNGWDSRKLIASNSDAYIYTETAGERLQVNSKETIHNTVLVMKAEATIQEYRFEFQHLNLDQLYSKLYLLDLVGNKYIDITANNSSYSFTATNDDEAQARFVIKSAFDSNPEHDANTVFVIKENNRYLAVNKLQTEVDVMIYDVSGRLYSKQQIPASGVVVLKSDLTIGVYLVKFNGAGVRKTEKLIIE